MRTCNISWTRLATALLVLVTATACEKNNLNSCNREIAVKAFSSTQTKAGTSTFPPTFGLYANYTTSPDGTDCKSVWETSTEKYLDNKCFATIDGGTTFANVNPQNITEHQPIYWPGAGSLMFTAYAPYASQSPCIKAVRYLRYAEPTNQSRMEIDIVLKEKPQGQKDAATIGLTEDNNPLDLLWVDTRNINGNKSIGSQPNAVPLKFFHAMSKVTVKITNPEAQYKVTAKLLHCINAATFYSGNTPGWKPDFTNMDNGTVDYILFDNLNLGTTEESSSVCVIPAQLNAQYQGAPLNFAQPITLRITLMNKDGIGKQTRDFNLSDYTKTWLPTKHYIYNLTINSQKIEFSEPIIENRDQIIEP